MKSTNLIASLIFTISIIGCAEQKNSSSISTNENESVGPWIGEIYPDSNKPSKSKSIGGFTSYDACYEAAMKELGGEGVFNCSIT